LNESQQRADQHQTVETAVGGQIDDDLAVRWTEVEHQDGDEPAGQHDDPGEQTSMRLGQRLQQTVVADDTARIFAKITPG